MSPTHLTQYLTFHRVQAKLRAGEEGYDWLSSNHAWAFYANHKTNPQRLEDGFLKSALLVKVRL
jgi:hypothetical protein